MSKTASGRRMRPDSSRVAWTSARKRLRLAKPVLTRLFANMYQDMRGMESELRKASCNWTLVVPPQLTDKPPTGHYRIAQSHNVRNGFSIRRADLARAILDLIADRSTFREFVFVAN